jgi:hypothetical protein
VVFEIERSSSADDVAGIDQVRSLSKLFAQACNVIIILCEADAILAFGKDRAREEYILVPDLSAENALKFVQARKGQR